MPDRSSEQQTPREKRLSASSVTRALVAKGVVFTTDWYERYFEKDVDKEMKKISERLTNNKETLEELLEKYGALFTEGTSKQEDTRRKVLVLWISGYQLADNQAVESLAPEVWQNLDRKGFINQREMTRRRHSMGGLKADVSAQQDIKQIMLKGSAANIPGAVARV